MNAKYRHVWTVSHTEIYQFIKSTNTKITDYTFKNYFDYIVAKYHIKVLEHHFENDMILGITMIDKLGISLSYEKETSTSRQNFTKCHEIGHIVLNHQGKVFKELNKNRQPLELEANYFASILLAPDIILLDQILYQNKTFYSIAKDLLMSPKALAVRLRQFVEKYSTIPFYQAKRVVYSFKANNENRIELINIFKAAENQIVSHYNNITIDPYKKFDFLYHTKGIVTNILIKDLQSQTFRKTIQKNYTDVKFQVIHNIWYAWNTNKLDKDEAYQRAIWINTSNNIKGTR